MLKSLLKKHFDKHEHSLTLTQSAKPFITNKNSIIVKKLVECIEYATNITPTLSTAGGTSDARFFGEYGIETVEFGVKNDRIHAPNERTSIKEVRKLKNIFTHLINEL